MTELRLTAYRVSAQTLDLVPAPVRRPWMDATDQRFANRCLPLLMANQSGWVMVSRHHLAATWDGQGGKAALTVDVTAGDGAVPAISHFGGGILTWHVPWLFRTPPGWNLLVRGPANWPKDGAAVLEGLVETDWSPATFTVNWLLTRPGTVTVEVGEPVAMIVPQRRGDLERFDPAIRDVADDPGLASEYGGWAASREEFNGQLAAGQPEAAARGWQRDYFLSGEPGHQRKRALRPFGDKDGPGER